MGVMADTFMCEMKVGQFQRKTEYADYRGRSVLVEMGDFSCSGIIDSNLTVTTTIQSGTTDEVKSDSGQGFSSVIMYTLDQWGDGQERLECTCSLN